MALVSPTSINDPSLPLPDRADRATFADRMAEQFRWQRDDLAPGVETLATQAYENAAEAVSAATGALAAANYKGSWSTLSGAIAIPASVHHSGTFWALLQSVPDVAAVTPGVSPVWAQIGGVSKSGDTMTGPLNVPAGATGTQVPQAQEVVGVTGGSVGAAKIPSGTTAQRPTPAIGHDRFNSTIGRKEYYNGSAWRTDGTFAAQTIATTSGTAIDFENIPAWVTRIELVFNGVSLNGSDQIVVQVGGASGFVASGYTQSSERIVSLGIVDNSASNGFVINISGATWNVFGSLLIFRPISGNDYVSSHALRGAQNVACVGGGGVTMTEPLTRVRVTRSGSNAFDAGSVTLYWS